MTKNERVEKLYIRLDELLMEHSDTTAKIRKVLNEVWKINTVDQTIDDPVADLVAELEGVLGSEMLENDDFEESKFATYPDFISYKNTHNQVLDKIKEALNNLKK